MTSDLNYRVLEKTIESIPTGILVVNQLGQILRYNSKFIEIWNVPLGVMREESQVSLLKHIQSQLTNPELFMKKREDDFALPVTQYYDNRFALRDGRWIEVFRRTEQVDEHTQVRVICVNDVTDRVRLEARLKHRDRILTIGKMAAGIAHEVNNPLTHLIGGLELAIETLGDSTGIGAAEIGELAEKLRVFHSSAVRISDIVRDLKTFSRPDADVLDAVDVKSVIESTLALLGSELGRKATLKVSLGPAPVVLANEGRLGQVLMNLLINAAEAMNGEDPAVNEISISSGIDSMSRVFIEIRDNGRGIPADDLKRSFEPFFTTKGATGGTGLGLAICYSIVQGLKGDIEVDSEIGKGTRFRVILPVLSTKAPPVNKASVPMPARAKKSVLVIDDEEEICELIKGALGIDHDVDCRRSGGEAISLLLARPRGFDLILCDLSIPIVDGIKVFKTVQAAHPEIAERFLFITGGALSKEAERVLKMHSRQILHKPFSLKRLRETVAQRINT